MTTDEYNRLQREIQTVRLAIGFLCDRNKNFSEELHSIGMLLVSTNQYLTDMLRREMMRKNENGDGYVHPQPTIGV